MKPPVDPALLQGSILRPLVRLALPFMLGNFVGLANLAIDRVWVGRVGTEALAALGIAQATLGVMFTIHMGMAVGTLAGVARSTGAGRGDDAGRYLVQGLLISLGLGAVMAAAGLALPAAVLAFMGAEPSVAGPAEGYLGISMLGLLAQGPGMALMFALQGAGEAKAALRISVVAPLVNAVLDPLFIFVLDGGLPGAAWATNLANATSLALGLWTVRRGQLRLRWPAEPFRFRADYARRIFGVGLPGSLEQTVRTVASFSLVKILNGFGATVVSAYTGTTMVVMVLIFPGLAVGQATASLVGQNLGAGQRSRAVRTAWLATAAYAGFMALVGLIIYATAPHLVAVFDPNPAVVAEGAAQLRVLVWCMPTLGVALILGKAFGGAGNTVPAMISATVAHVVFQIPAAWWLSERYGAQGAYWAMAGAFGIHGLLSAALFVGRVQRARAGAEKP